MEANTLLSVTDLQVSFKTSNGYLNAISNVSFSIREGETVAVVGESGCGKSVTALSLMKLLPSSAQMGGKVMFDGNELLSLKNSSMRQIRGKSISMIFQEPMTSLNPVLRIGDQLTEPLRMHEHLSTRERSKRATQLLEIVGIPRPEEVAREYPHQLSGGMRQRVMIAMAMACQPRLLIADEPTTALDVTVQAQILDLLRSLKRDNNMALLLITHDLGVVAEMCTRVIVMYAGKIVEEADVESIFYAPRHPYTIGLMDSTPKITGERERLQPISGNVPSLLNMPQGCRFAPRCKHVKDICRTAEPEPRQVSRNHYVRCWLQEEFDATGVRQSD